MFFLHYLFRIYYPRRNAAIFHVPIIKQFDIISRNCDNVRIVFFQPFSRNFIADFYLLAGCFVNKHFIILLL